MVGQGGACNSSEAGTHGKRVNVWVAYQRCGGGPPGLELRALRHRCSRSQGSRRWCLNNLPLNAAINAESGLGSQVRRREQGIPLPGPGEVPKEEPVWLYLSLIWDVMGTSYCERTRKRIRVQFDRAYGEGAWAKAVDFYREHLGVVDEAAPVSWQEYPITSPPFELERVMNPMSGRLFHGDYHRALMYHQYVREARPGLILSWARIIAFIDQYTETIGEDWKSERSMMNEPQTVLLEI